MRDIRIIFFRGVLRFFKVIRSIKIRFVIVMIRLIYVESFRYCYCRFWVSLIIIIGKLRELESWLGLFWFMG